MNRAVTILGGLLLLWLGLMLGLAGLAQRGLGELRALRQHHVTLIAQSRAAPPATMRWPSALTASAPDRPTAIRDAAARVRSLGRLVTVDAVEPLASADPSFVPLRIAAHGDAAAVLRFIGRIEGADPGFRFQEMALKRDDAAGGLRLEGQLISFWRTR
jgi:hypothetical protein